MFIYTSEPTRSCPCKSVIANRVKSSAAGRVIRSRCWCLFLTVTAACLLVTGLQWDKRGGYFYIKQVVESNSGHLLKYVLKYNFQVLVFCSSVSILCHFILLLQFREKYCICNSTLHLFDIHSYSSLFKFHLKKHYGWINY